MEMQQEPEPQSPEDEALVGMSPQDRLTYDPTQGQGTPAWELSRRTSLEANADLRRN